MVVSVFSIFSDSFMFSFSQQPNREIPLKNEVGGGFYFFFSPFFLSYLVAQEIEKEKLRFTLYDFCFFNFLIPNCFPFSQQPNRQLRIPRYK